MIIPSTVNHSARPDSGLYGTDPRERPLYNYPEVARATEVPASTVRAWVAGQRYRWDGGQGYFEPLIQRPDPNDSRLSFTNVIEVFVLRALRTTHDVPMQRVREAIAIAEHELGIDRLLIHRGLKTDASKLFLDTYSNVVELSRSGQYIMRKVLESYLKRVDFARDDLPESLFPFPRSMAAEDEKVIEISPFVSFGRPIIREAGVTTIAIVKRLDAGESLETLQKDYAITESQIEEAVLYEYAA